MCSVYEDDIVPSNSRRENLASFPLAISNKLFFMYKKAPFIQFLFRYRKTYKLMSSCFKQQTLEEGEITGIRF